jgi:hypothetical protein
VKDSLQNVGMISEAKAHGGKHYQDEMSLLMWVGTAIWCSGTFGMKAVYEATLHQGGLPFAGANYKLLGPQEKEQPLNAATVAQYQQRSAHKFKHSPHLQQALQRKLANTTKLLSSAPNTTALTKRLKMAQLIGLGASAVLPAYLMGFQLQAWAHQWTEGKMAKEKEARAAARLASATPGTPEDHVKPRSAASGASTAFWKGVDVLHESPTLANAALVDGTFTLGRASQAQDSYDLTQWMTNEAIAIFMIYYGSEALNGLNKQGLKRLAFFKPAAPVMDMPFNALQQLHQHYQQPSQHARKPSFNQHFNQALKELNLEHLQGLSETAFSQALLNEQPKLLAAVRQHTMQQAHTPGNNMIVDALIASEVLPTWKENALDAWSRGQQRRVLGVDITKAANLADTLVSAPWTCGQEIKSWFGGPKAQLGLMDRADNVAGVVHKLHQLAHMPPQQTQQALHRGMHAKTAALGLSLLGAFVVLGTLSPKIQHQLAAKVSGQSAPTRLLNTEA